MEGRVDGGGSIWAAQIWVERFIFYFSRSTMTRAACWALHGWTHLSIGAWHLRVCIAILRDY